MSLCQKLVLTFVPRYSYGSMLRYVTMSKREKRTQSDCTSQETNSTVKKAKQQSVKNGATSHTTDSIKSTDSDAGKFIYEEKPGDLFSCDPHASLAHCISADIAMGKGIAVLFKKKFGGVDELKRQGKKVGEVAILRRDGRFIYYLVTKQRYFHKPTYNTLQASLLAMKEHCQQNSVTDVAMPKIGCGLDRLQWDRVSQMLKEIFGDLKMTLTVYSL